MMAYVLTQQVLDLPGLHSETLSQSNSKGRDRLKIQRSDRMLACRALIPGFIVTTPESMCVGVINDCSWAAELEFLVFLIFYFLVLLTDYLCDS